MTKQFPAFENKEFGKALVVEMDGQPCSEKPGRALIGGGGYLG